MIEWKLLPLIEEKAAKQMAIDEAILITRAKNLVPNTLRFYTWKPSAVSLGYFQSVEQEVNLENLKKFKVDLVRRITGGGAVFHDQELTYSLIISEEKVPKDIQESYELICGALVKGLEKIGITTEFREINDILAGGRKISGSAQTRRNGVVLQHGTLLLDVNLKRMFSLLKIPNEKIRDKMIKKVEERVTSIKKELGRELGKKEILSALREGFEDTFNVSFQEGKLTSEEKKLARKLYQKYASKEWTFKR